MLPDSEKCFECHSFQFLQRIIASSLQTKQYSLSHFLFVFLMINRDFMMCYVKTQNYSNPFLRLFINMYVQYTYSKPINLRVMGGGGGGIGVRLNERVRLLKISKHGYLCVLLMFETKTINTNTKGKRDKSRILGKPTG